MSPWPDIPDGVAFPPHVYIPGQTPRHADTWFDDIKASVPTDVRPEALRHTVAFKTGLAFFETGYFWECHEVLEAVWHRTVNPSSDRALVQAVIQLANARLKLLMGQPRAARRLCDMVAGHIASCDQKYVTLGIDLRDIEDRLVLARKSAKNAI